MALWIMAILFTAIAVYILSIRVCAPCTYQFNNRDYGMGCAELCLSTPKWKIIIFELTGRNIDYPKVYMPKVI